MLISLLKNRYFPLFLFFYHMAFTVAVWQLGLQADSYFYWFNKETAFGWLQYQPFPMGNSFMLYLNYVPAYLLRIPLWVGDLIYSCIGFTGIFYWHLSIQKYINFTPDFKRLQLPKLLLLFPSLHLWTSFVGKEAILFSLMSLIFYRIISKKNWWFTALFFIPIVLIRPHTAAMILAAAVLSFLLTYPTRWWNKLIVAICGLLIGIAAIYSLLYTANFQNIDISAIKQYIQAHHTVFKDTPSYVPMEEYSIPWQLFTFYFRPIAAESLDLLGWFYGLENMVFLGLFLIWSYFLILNYKVIKFSFLQIFIFVLALVYALVYAQLYSNFGIIARTKILVTPFIYIIQIHIIFQLIKNPFKLK